MTFTIDPEVKKQSIDTMKVNKEVLDYLHDFGCVTIQDVIDHQNEFKYGIKASVIAWLVYKITI